jgi:uncharacterized spore protein YtfJ
MTDDEDQAMEAAEHAASSGAAGLLATVLDRIGLNSGAKAVFGEPLEQDGRTVIPVAQTIIGSGAGGGVSEEDGQGEGAGGGALTRPLGYIEVSGEGAAFVPLKQPWQDPALVIAYALLALVIGRTLVRLIRG